MPLCLSRRCRVRACTIGPVLALALSACAAADIPIVSVTEANSQVQDGYRLTAGDKLKVTVFDEPNLTGEYQVGSAGELALPLIDPVPVAGRMPEEIAQSVAASLSTGGYVLEPRVSVEVLQYKPIYILGEVGSPGEYPYTGDLTFLQAVAKAGGFTPRADKGRVVLQRGGEGGRLVELNDSPLLIAPGDTVIVREAFF